MTHDKQLIERLNNAADKLDAVFDKDFAAQLCIREAAQALSTLTAEIEELREALVDHNDRLRSCCQVADRDGLDTNWKALRGQIRFTLAEHHEITNAARATLKGKGTER